MLDNYADCVYLMLISNGLLYMLNECSNEIEKAIVKVCWITGNSGAFLSLLLYYMRANHIYPICIATRTAIYTEDMVGMITIPYHDSLQQLKEQTADDYVPMEKHIFFGILTFQLPLLFILTLTYNKKILRITDVISDVLTGIVGTLLVRMVSAYVWPLLYFTSAGFLVHLGIW